MAITARKVPDAILFALVTAHNLTHRDRVENDTTYPHADITSTTSGDYTAPSPSSFLATAALATNLATTKTRANDVRKVLVAHFADAGSEANRYGGAHKAADTANAEDITVAEMPDLTSSSSQGDTNTFLNTLKTACLAHVDESGVHFTDDGTNTIAAADATDLASSVTLVNALYTFANAHIQFAPPAAQTVKVVPA